MDWTGGVRRRFAPGRNNAVVQKQKAHFAKARSALQKSPRSSNPPHPAAFGEELAPKVGMARNETGSARHRHPTHSLEHLGRQDRHARSPGEDLTFETEQQQPSQSDDSDVASLLSKPHGAPMPRASQDGTANLAGPPFPAEEMPSDTMNDEEHLLMANRRRLLARSDWLGLSATRPVHIKFRSSRDKDQIGKRRRVPKSHSQKGRPAIRRLLTPLFEEHCMPRDESLMSGALQQHDVRVKIGTDALISQSQQSRVSETPRVVARGRSSTELGPLSEEPMLLDDEGDGFVTIRSPRWYGRTNDMKETSASFLPSEMHHASRSDRDANSINDMLNSPLPIQQGSVVARMVEGEQPPSEVYEKLRAGSYTCENQAEGIHLHKDHLQVLDGDSPIQDRDALWREQEGAFAESSHLIDPVDSIDDEAFWSRLMHFESATPSNPSAEAVKSSSLHITASESSRRPHVPATSEVMLASRHLQSTPRGAGTQASFLHCRTTSDHTRDSSRDVTSFSTSLRQIRNLAGRTHPAHTKELKRDDEEAAWRAFIIGSQGSSSSSLRERWDDSRLSEDRPNIQPEANVSQFELSGLGTSVRSTGQATRVSDRNGEHPRPGMNVDGSITPASHRNRGSIGLRQPSPLVEAAQEDDDDAIEDFEDEVSRPAGPTVAARASVLNPRQFKSLRRAPETSSRNAAGAATASRARRMATTRPNDTMRSTYDLVDSDGISLT